MTPESLLLAASALHLGFQSTVTLATYPALAEVEPARWKEAHAAHSRRITWVVAPLYIFVATACAWVLVAGPWSIATMTAVAGNLVAVLSTAAVAAPTHQKLGRTWRSEELVARLLCADRVRFVAALVAFVAAMFA